MVLEQIIKTCTNMIQVERVSDQEAFCMCHRLARTEGLMVLLDLRLSFFCSSFQENNVNAGVVKQSLNELVMLFLKTRIFAALWATRQEYRLGPQPAQWNYSMGRTYSTRRK